MRRLLTGLALMIAIAVGLGLALGPGYVERGLNQVLHPGPYSTALATRKLHQTLFVADLHSDTLLWNRNLLDRGDRGHVDVPRLRDGGVALQVFSVVTQVPSGQNYDSNPGDSDVITALAILERWPISAWSSLRERALYQARVLRETAARSNGDLTLIQSAADLEAFAERWDRNRQAVGALLAIEGANMVEGDASEIDTLYDAGFRMIGLTHFFDNRVGGSAHGVDKGGLSEVGRRVVRRIEERRMIVDLAHASPRLIDDVLAVARRPVVVSHTGVKGTCDNVRNISDAHLRGIAATGGVVGIGYWDAAVCDVDAAGIVRAIRYAVDVAGLEHVALGSDFDGSTTTPFDTSGVPLITQGLIEAGFSPYQIKAIMGENVLRVLRATLP